MEDTIARNLRTDGIGASVNHAAGKKLWDSGAMGIGSPHVLANAVFFVNGKNLRLRGGREHYQLKLSQFEFGDDFVHYTENGSKNRSGSYKDTRLSSIMLIHL